jgi:hypothetical protein
VHWARPTVRIRDDAPNVKALEPLPADPDAARRHDH